MIKKLYRNLENLFTAAAFAEAGEHESAREVMGYETPARRTSVASKLQSMAMAVSFAEADCHEAALEILANDGSSKKAQTPSFLETVGLQGVQVKYCVAAT
jgi:hypothetical protein